MGFISFILAMIIVVGVLTAMDNAIVRHRNRCEQLKAYIKFLETAELVEDAHEGAQWLQERAQRRLECDIQDITYN
tara:strand:+ start:478 stop:705 length:228 start_codon:yes stop_codon:yes gene_type:complete